MDIPPSSGMAALDKQEIQARSELSLVARTLSRKRSPEGGRGQGFFVRLTPEVERMLQAAKASKQSMPDFLRESGITIALQRLAESQI